MTHADQERREMPRCFFLQGKRRSAIVKFSDTCRMRFPKASDALAACPN
jgi:hypothetical protein